MIDLFHAAKVIGYATMAASIMTSLGVWTIALILARKAR